MAKANYDLPEEKLMQVVEYSGARSKREAIILALDEYLKNKQLQKLVQQYGKRPLRWTKKTLRAYRG
ncbi:MAG: hypothetical protein A3I05_06450 [Deltaproteobacteria bacterium RIFCSPLOWO2_02_FULL_44_10]|nr:MAG: hypothetical protein A3C46_06655 [Deltaproteobacteria bacterium RIFCSPHIGHO2_02_FULL_44_16]OGQ46679.1 MAG: hypothetical protein A3I05_06450 [Deltaproteobacteria bacterium RIFCSPLOWO2_02_FULL_44_10]